MELIRMILSNGTIAKSSKGLKITSAVYHQARQQKKPSGGGFFAFSSTLAL
jgi:hypothetical protein